METRPCCRCQEIRISELTNGLAGAMPGGVMARPLRVEYPGAGYHGIDRAEGGPAWLERQRPAEPEESWKVLRRGWHVGGDKIAARRLDPGLDRLGLAGRGLASAPKVSAEKAALGRWWRGCGTGLRRCLGARLDLGHDTNARCPSRRRSRAGQLRFQQAWSEAATSGHG